jgi:hypothetical protein
VFSANETTELQVSGRRGPVGSRAIALRIKFFESDGSVFVDDEYLIKGVAGRILWRVVTTYVAEQRDTARAPSQPGRGELAPASAAILEFGPDPAARPRKRSDVGAQSRMTGTAQYIE